MKLKLIKIGNSLGIIIPRKLLKNQKEGDEIEIIFKNVITSGENVITSGENVITSEENVITSPKPKNDSVPTEKCFCKACQLGKKCLYK